MLNLLQSDKKILLNGKWVSENLKGDYLLKG